MSTFEQDVPSFPADKADTSTLLTDDSPLPSEILVNYIMACFDPTASYIV